MNVKSPSNSPFVPCHKPSFLPDCNQDARRKVIGGNQRSVRLSAEAGPAWRAACDYGFDMSLVEDALRRMPEERLEEHQRALNLVLEIMAARELTCSMVQDDKALL